jgi:hypothetical protein
MQMYPAYRRRDVLEEYTVSFYGLLEEGYRKQREHELMLINIALMPHIEPQTRSDYIEKLQWAAKTPGDILNPDDQGSVSEGIAGVKKMFRGSI